MINLKDARQVIAAAEAKAHELGQPMNHAPSRPARWWRLYLGIVNPQ